MLTPVRERERKQRQGSTLRGNLKLGRIELARDDPLGKHGYGRSRSRHNRLRVRLKANREKRNQSGQHGRTFLSGWD